MTNLQTIAGGMIWSAVALTLMAITFAPVDVGYAPIAAPAYAAAPAAGTPA